MTRKMIDHDDDEDDWLDDLDAEIYPFDDFDEEIEEDCAEPSDELYDDLEDE
jgi:hypothetical protein